MKTTCYSLNDETFVVKNAGGDRYYHVRIHHVTIDDQRRVYNSVMCFKSIDELLLAVTRENCDDDFIAALTVPQDLTRFY